MSGAHPEKFFRVHHSEAQVSATDPDWSREATGQLEWRPGQQLLRAIRAYQSASGPLAPAQRRAAVLAHRFWSVVTGASIPLDCKIEGGLRIPHPVGIVIHPDAVIGPNCLLFQQVTLGVGERPGLPHLVGHVDVGAGAKILGGVTIGEHAKIGANSVVIDDVPPGCTAIGIPARIVRSRTTH